VVALIADVTLTEYLLTTVVHTETRSGQYCGLTVVALSYLLTYYLLSS